MVFRKSKKQVHYKDSVSTRLNVSRMLENDSNRMVIVIVRLKCGIDLNNTFFLEFFQKFFNNSSRIYCVFYTLV